MTNRKKDPCSYCGKTGGDTRWADEIGLHCSLCSPFEPRVKPKQKPDLTTA